MARLGCGDYNVFVTSKCAGKRICDMTGITGLEYNRLIDDISTAKVELATGDASSACCRCLPDVEPWCHELHILRNGEEVWMGPVTRTTYKRETVVIEAADVLAWLTVRRLPFNVNFTNNDATGDLANAVSAPFYTNITEESLTLPAGQSGALGPAPIGSIARYLIHAGFGPPYQSGTANRFNDPCVLDSLLIIGEDDFAQQRFFQAYEQTPFESLQDLAEGGLNFTVVGRRILVVANPDLILGTLAPIGVLQDEHIMGDVDIVKDGANFATGFYVRWMDDDLAATCASAQGVDEASAITPCPAFVGFSDTDDFEGNTGSDPDCSDVVASEVPDSSFCYGRVERLVDLSDIADLCTAKHLANDYFQASFPAPRVLEFPAGTRLSPSTPFDIQQLVPGIRVDAVLTRSCLEVGQAFRLQEMNVTVDENGDEAVSVTLSDFNLFSSSL